MSEEMAAAFCFMGGNNETQKNGQNICAKACHFSQLDEANQYRKVYGESIDIINEWTCKAFGELQPWIG